MGQKNWRELLLQFVKFGLVGVSSAFVLLVVYYTLIFLHVNYIVAYSVGFIVSVLNAYFWNNKYVFTQSSSSFLQKLYKCYVSYITTFIISTALLYLWVDIVRISDIIAPIINIILTTPLNYYMNKKWAFKR